MVTIQEYSLRLQAALNTIDQNELDLFVERILSCSRNAGTVWIAGNGGSASTADHMATDLMMGIDAKSPIRCVSISSNNSVITATGNDFGFDQIFERSVTRLARGGDVLVLISASGNSQNLIRAAEVASSKNLTVVSVTGFDGGRLKEISDISIHCETAVGDYGIAEDCHLAVNHYVKERVISNC